MLSKCGVFVAIVCLMAMTILSPSVADDKSSSSSSFYDFDSQAEIPGSASEMLVEYVTESEREKAREYIAMCHNRPRYSYFSTDMNLTKQAARFCLYTDASDFGTCDFVTYAESIVLLMVPVLAVVIVFIPVAAIYFICRCCTCGRYVPTRKFCGGERMTENWVDGVDGYKTESVVGLQVAACLSGAVVVVGAIIVEVGNRSVGTNFDGAVAYVEEVTTSLVGTLNKSLDTVEYLSEEFGDLIDSEGIASTLQAARDIGIQLEEYDNLVNEWYPKIAGPRQTTLMILMIVPCVGVVFLLLGAFIGYPCFTCTSVVLSCLSIPITLLLFGIHYPIGNAVSDICYFIDSATDVTSPDYVDFLASFYDCDDDSPIGTISSILDTAADQAVSFFCSNVTDLCNMAEVPCDKDEDGRIPYDDIENSTCPVIDCSGVPKPCDETTLNETLFRVVVNNYLLSCFEVKSDCVSVCPTGDLYAERKGDHCGTINALDQCDESTVIVAGNQVQKEYPLFCGRGDAKPISLDDCAERCAFSETQKFAKTLVRFRNAAGAILDLLFNTIKPFLRCTTIVRVLYNVQDFACVKVMNSLRPLTSGSLAVAVGLLAMVVVGTLGAKRFDRKYRFQFTPVVEGEDDIEMEETGGTTKELQTTVVEYDVSEVEEDCSVVEVVEEEDDDDE